MVSGLQLEKLLSRSEKRVELRPEGQTCWVVNLSKKVLTPGQEEISKKVLNFAPVPTSFCCRTLLQVWSR